MRDAFITAAALVALSATAVQAKEPLRLEPSTPWVMDYAEDSCKLRRGFGGEGDDMYILEFQQYGPSPEFDVTVVGSDLRAIGREVDVRWNKSDEPETIRLRMEATFGTRTGYVFADRFIPSIEEMPQIGDMSEAEIVRMQETAERNIYGLQLTGGSRPNVFFATGQLLPAFTAMRACTDKLMTHWGIDLAAHHSRLQGPEPIDQRRWARYIQEEYPGRALKNGQDGTLRIRMMIDANGKPTSCHSQYAFKPEDFAEIACKLMMRYSKFEPAIAADGTPMSSFLPDHHYLSPELINLVMALPLP